MDEKADRLEASQVPFFETYSEIVLVEQALGKPSECEVIVVRIHKSLLKLYSFSLIFMVFLFLVAAFQS